MYDFLKNQPHPEKEETACVSGYAGPALLKPALDLPVSACGGTWTGGNFQLFVTKKDEPRKVYRYQGPAVEELREAGLFASFDLPVTGISCFEGEDGGGLCVAAGELVIFDREGRQTGRPGVIARHGSLLWDGGEPWLCYDGKIRRLREGLDGFAGEAVEITAKPFRLNGARYDALFAENRSRPGLSGGSLFRHRGRYHYAFSDRFRRCAEDNLDGFCCSAEKLTGDFERRYLLLPNGGIVNLFHGEGGRPYAAFIGASPRSAVYGKPAVIPLEYAGDEFFRPAALGESSPAVLETGSVPSLRPLPEIREIRDTFIYNAPDGFYYLTGTTRRPGGNHWNNTGGVQVWRSPDLERFESLGTVFDYEERPESWQNQVSRNHNCWAPEIIFYENTFWITYSTAPGCGLLKSAGGKIEGPYLDMGRVVNKGIDSGFFLEDERLYLIWQNGRIAPVSRDGRTMTEEPVLLLPEDGQEVGYEGAGLIKVRGPSADRYVLYAAEWNGDYRIDGSYDMMYATAPRLAGPYGPRRLLVPHGGHGCLFYDKQGRLRYTLFGNDRSAPFRRGAGTGFVKIEERGGDLFLSV